MPTDSDAVLAAAQGSFLGALVADALDDKTMILDAKAVGSGNFVSESNNFVAGKFDQLPTLGAVLVVVFWVTVVEFVHAPTV
jgi:hypothetical protein